MSNGKSCPVFGSFCWRNPLQVAALLAVLPWAVKSVGWLWGAVCSLASCAAK